MIRQGGEGSRPPPPHRCPKEESTEAEAVGGETGWEKMQAQTRPGEGEEAQITFSLPEVEGHRA